MAKRIQRYMKGTVTAFSIFPLHSSRDGHRKHRFYRSDADALRADWEKVGLELAIAYKEASSDQPAQ